MKSVIAFACGAALVMILFWICGYDFPRERGGYALFFLFETACGGWLGVCLQKLSETFKTTSK